MRTSVHACARDVFAKYDDIILIRLIMIIIIIIIYFIRIRHTDDFLSTCIRLVHINSCVCKHVHACVYHSL